MAVLPAGIARGGIPVVLADVRCPVCERRWHRAEVTPYELVIEAKCDSARCHGALRTVCWVGGRAILISNDMRPDATERGAPETKGSAPWASRR